MDYTDVLQWPSCGSLLHSSWRTRCLGRCEYSFNRYYQPHDDSLKIPVQLAEISPPAFRATFPGVAYQVGNMVSSASAQIEATGGDQLRTTIDENGVPTNVPNYAEVQGILIGVVAAFVLVVTILGPE